MDSLEYLNLPSTPEASAVKAYLQAQAAKDFSRAEQFFTQDVVYNDVMFPSKGRNEVSESLAQYTKDYLTTFRVEAANEAGSRDRYLVLCIIALRGKEETIATCEVISLKEGKICRVDNCFNAEKLKALYWK